MIARTGTQRQAQELTDADQGFLLPTSQRHRVGQRGEDHGQQRHRDRSNNDARAAPVERAPQA